MTDHLNFEFTISKDLIEQIEKAASVGLENVIDDVKAEAEARAPFEHGSLKASVDKQFIPGDTEGFVTVGTDHWHVIEYGSPPHTIEATNKKVLASGGEIFGPVVHHPGSQPNPFMRNALYRKRVLRFKGK